MVFLFIFSVPLRAESPFAQATLGTRATAMGGAFSAQANDLSALYWNPAGFAFQKERYVESGWYYARFRYQTNTLFPSAEKHNDISRPGLTGVVLPNIGDSVSLAFGAWPYDFQSGDTSRYQIESYGIAAAYEPIKTVSIGVTVRMLTGKAYLAKSNRFSNALQVTAGFLKKGKKADLSVVLRTLTTLNFRPRSDFGKQEIPTTMVFGLSYHGQPRLRFNADMEIIFPHNVLTTDESQASGVFERQSDLRLRFHTGWQYWFRTQGVRMAVRQGFYTVKQNRLEAVGVGRDQVFVTFGYEARWRNWRMGSAFETSEIFTPAREVGDGVGNHGLKLSLGWGF